MSSVAKTDRRDVHGRRRSLRWWWGCDKTLELCARVRLVSSSNNESDYSKTCTIKATLSQPSRRNGRLLWIEFAVRIVFDRRSGLEKWRARGRIKGQRLKFNPFQIDLSNKNDRNNVTTQITIRSSLEEYSDRNRRSEENIFFILYD